MRRYAIPTVGQGAADLEFASGNVRGENQGETHPDRRAIGNEFPHSPRRYVLKVSQSIADPRRSLHSRQAAAMLASLVQPLRRLVIRCSSVAVFGGM